MPFDPLVLLVGIYSQEIIRNVSILAAGPVYYASVVDNSDLLEVSYMSNSESRWTDFGTPTRWKTYLTMKYVFTESLNRFAPPLQCSPKFLTDSVLGYK